MTETKPIPQAVAERCVSAFASFVSAVREAVSAAGSPGTAVWHRKVLPLLESRLAAAEAAAAQYAAGNQQPLVNEALPLRFLARDMDGYSFSFAGEAAAEDLQQKRRLVVYAAWQVCHAAGAV